MTLQELRQLVAHHRRLIKRATSAHERERHEAAIAAYKDHYVRATCAACQRDPVALGVVPTPELPV